MNKIEQKKTIFKVEQHYKQQIIINRCEQIKKYADYLIEDIKKNNTRNLYIGNIIAEVEEIRKTFYGLQTIEENLKLIQEIEEENNE